MRETYEANRWLGDIYMQKLQAKKAIPYFEKASQINPHEIYVLYNLSAAYLMDNQFDKARATYSVLKRIQPGSSFSVSPFSEKQVFGRVGCPDLFLPLISFMLVVAINQLMWILFAPITVNATRFFGVSDPSIGRMLVFYGIASVIAAVVFFTVAKERPPTPLCPPGGKRTIPGT